MMISERPQLRVINGGGERSSQWLDIPATAIGRSWTGPSNLRSYRIARDDARKGLERGAKQSLLDLWSLVLGEVPPVPLSTRYSHLLQQLKKRSLAGAHACFRGVKRPVGNDDTGYDTVIFVAKPMTRFTYDPSQACVIKPIPFAIDLVFVTYARLDYPVDPRVNVRSRNGNGPTGGVITHWGAVECDPSQSDLPVNFGERYRERLW